MDSSLKSSPPVDDADKCSSSSTEKPVPKMVNRVRPPSDSAGTREGSSAQEPPAAPSSLLCRLLGLAFLRMQRRLAHDAVPSPNVSLPLPGAANLTCSRVATNGNTPGAGHPRRPARFSTIGSQLSAANPGRTPSLPMKLFMLLQEPPGGPTSPLRFLLMLSFLRMQRLRPLADDVPSEANRRQTGVAHSQQSTAAAEENLHDAANTEHSAPSATNGSLKRLSVNPWHRRRTRALAVKLLMLAYSGRRSTQVSEDRTLADASYILGDEYGLRYQMLLGTPLILVIQKIRTCLGRCVVLSYLTVATGRSAGIFRSFSIKLAEGGFAAKLCSFVLGRFGYEWLPFAQLAQFINLVSTFFRHAGSALNSASDILCKVNEFCTVNGAQPRHSQEGNPSTGESNDSLSQETPGTGESNDSLSEETFGTVSEGQHIIISSGSQGLAFLSNLKAGGNQNSADVPPNMSLATAVKLKTRFEVEGAEHLLKGDTITSILKDGLVSAQCELERATKKIGRASAALCSVATIRQEN